MRVYITSYQLLNFQSWDDSTKPIHLDTDIINIIEGANETGKSVLYKVLYNFAFPGYWDPKELIRRGCSSGVLLLELSNGKCVVFQLEHKHHTYILVDAEEEHVWKDCPLPKEIIDELGLILDYDLKIILNVIDKDISLPFIKTSPKFNASLIKARVEPPDITEFFQNTDEFLKTLANASLSFSGKTRELKAAADAIKYTDVDTLNSAKEKVDNLIPIITHYSEIEETLSNILSILTTAPSPVKDPSAVQDLVDMDSLVASTSSTLAEVQKVIVSKPTEVYFNPEVADLLKQYDNLTTLSEALSQHTLLLNTNPKEVECPNLSSEFAVLDLTAQISTIFKTMTSDLQGYQDITSKMNSVNADLEKIRQEVGVCPTCGRLLDAK